MLKKVQSVEREKAELVKEKEALIERVNSLTEEVSNTEAMYIGVANELAEARSVMEKLNTGTRKLDEVLGKGKMHGDKTGLGFVHGASSSASGVNTFVKAVSTSVEPGKIISKVKSAPKVNRFIPTCHFYGKLGHIRPKCYRFRTYLDKCLKIRNICCAHTLTHLEGFENLK